MTNSQNSITYKEAILHSSDSCPKFDIDIAHTSLVGSARVQQDVNVLVEGDNDEEPEVPFVEGVTGAVSPNFVMPAVLQDPRVVPGAAYDVYVRSIILFSLACIMKICALFRQLAEQCVNCWAGYWERGVTYTVWMNKLLQTINTTVPLPVAPAGLGKKKLQVILRQTQDHKVAAAYTTQCIWVTIVTLGFFLVAVLILFRMKIPLRPLE